MIIPPEAEDWATEAGIPRIPDAYDVVESVLTSSINASITSPNMFETLKGSVPIIGSASGDDFDFYRLQYGAGLNPKSWLQIGKDINEPVRNSQLAVWDTTDLSGLYALQLIVSYEEGTVESATIQVTVDNQKPRLNIQYPGEDDIFSFSQEEELSILVDATDELELAVVEIFIDDDLVASLNHPPYAYPWSMVLGEHILRVRAVDKAGNASDAKIIFFVEE